MKDKLTLAAMLALFIIAAFFMAFSLWLAQMLGYYLLLLDGFFGVCFVVLFRWLKAIEDTPTKELDVPETQPLIKP